MCRTGRAPTKATVRIAEYADDFAQVVGAYKYHGKEEIEQDLASWLALGVRRMPWFDRIEAVVSVPTHWKRGFTRLFHAADAIGKAVADELDLPFARVLRRTRAGRHQVGLNHQQRLANVRGAFALRRGVELTQSRLLLVDDVRTTGATMNECAKVLRRGGAAEVYAAVLGTVGWDGGKSTPITMI